MIKIKKSVRFAIVGCGRISTRHLEAIKENEHAELVAVCDIVPEKADQKAEEYGVLAFYDYDEMLKNIECDVISICTPSGIHPQQVIKAAQHKFHVVCEKPLGIRLNEVDEAIKACDENNVKLFVVKQNRLNPPVKLLINAIKKNRFGRIFLCEVNVFWTRPQAYYDMAKWRGTWEFDGGCLMNQASHYIDLMIHLVGPISKVRAFTATLARRIETEDTAVVAVKFRSGALGTVNVTVLTYPKNYEGSITIIGEKGTVKIGGFALNKIEHWIFEQPDEDDKLVNKVNTTPPDVYGFGHKEYYKRVIEVLNGNEKALDVDGREGRKSVEAILAMYESARLEKDISLPLNGHLGS